MKKLFIFSLSLLASVLATASTVSSDNTFGILKITASGPETVICVPWVGVGGGSVNVSNIVLTSNLQVGDRIYYYDTESTKYKIWELNTNAGEDKIWEPCTTVTTIAAIASPGEADQQTLPRGNALIVKMKSETFESRTDKDIYIYGQYAALTAGDATTISHPTGDKKQLWNLIAPPSTASGGYNLNTAAWDPTPNDKDYIIVEAGSTYYWKKSTGKWGTYTWDTTNEAWIFDETEATIPQGKGAWYVAVGARAGEAVKCTWQ